VNCDVNINSGRSMDDVRNSKQEQVNEGGVRKPSFLRRRRLTWSLWFLGYGLLAAVAFAVGCAVGPVTISPGKVVRIILSNIGMGRWQETWTAAQEMIVLKIRVPRALTGLVVGASLGVVGTAFQCILRNPLADPFILGVSSGAALGACIAIVFGIAIPFLPSASLPAIAFLGAMLATVFIYRLAMVHGSINPHTLILCGVILNSFLSSVMMMIYSAARPDRIHSLLLWLMGDLESAGDWLVVPLALMLVGTLWTCTFAKKMNAMTLGDEAAFSLGVDAASVKRAVFLISAVVVGSAVSTAGIIGFVGLVAPHLCRTLVTADHRFVLPSSALLGGALVVLADTFGRWVLSPAELPVGAVTALIGAPFFIYILKKRAKIVWADQ